MIKCYIIDRFGASNNYLLKPSEKKKNTARPINNTSDPLPNTPFQSN